MFCQTNFCHAGATNLPTLSTFFGLLRWAVEGCENVIPSKICDLITYLAQQ